MMKTIVFLLLSCTGLLAGEEINISTTIKTNADTGVVFTKRYFTRYGVTNLSSSTYTSNGAVVHQSYRFFHDGDDVANYMYHAGGDEVYFNNWSKYRFRFWTVSNNISEAWITDDSGIVDIFVRTNGVLAPDPTNDWASRYYTLPDATNRIPNNR